MHDHRLWHDLDTTVVTSVSGTAHWVWSCHWQRVILLLYTSPLSFLQMAWLSAVIRQLEFIQPFNGCAIALGTLSDALEALANAAYGLSCCSVNCHESDALAPIPLVPLLQRPPAWHPGP